MFPDVRKELERAGVSVPKTGTMKLYHAGPSSKLGRIEADLEIPGAKEPDGKLRVYVATSPDIAEVIPHADGAVEVLVDVNLELELGMGAIQDWVELVYDVPPGKNGMPIMLASRVMPGP